MPFTDKIQNNNTIFSLNDNQLKHLDVAVFHPLFKGMNLFDSGPHVFVSINKSKSNNFVELNIHTSTFVMI